jgi:hypothetical protein
MVKYYLTPTPTVTRHSRASLLFFFLPIPLNNNANVIIVSYPQDDRISFSGDVSRKRLCRIIIIIIIIITRRRRSRIHGDDDVKMHRYIIRRIPVHNRLRSSPRIVKCRCRFRRQMTPFIYNISIVTASDVIYHPSEPRVRTSCWHVRSCRKFSSRDRPALGH